MPFRFACRCAHSRRVATLGWLLTRARGELGLNQQQVAERLADGANFVTVSRHERDVNVPEADRLERYITVLALDREEAWELWRAAEAGKARRRAEGRRLRREVGDATDASRRARGVADDAGRQQPGTRRRTP